MLTIVANNGAADMETIESLLPVEWTDDYLLFDGTYTDDQRADAHRYLAARLIEEAFDEELVSWTSNARQSVAVVRENGEESLERAIYLGRPLDAPELSREL